MFHVVLHCCFVFFGGLSYLSYCWPPVIRMPSRPSNSIESPSVSMRRLLTFLVMLRGYAALFLACIRRLGWKEEEAGVGFSDSRLPNLADAIYYYSGCLSKTLRRDRAVKLWPVGLATSLGLPSWAADGLPPRGDLIC